MSVTSFSSTPQTLLLRHSLQPRILSNAAYNWTVCDERWCQKSRHSQCLVFYIWEMSLYQNQLGGINWLSETTQDWNKYGIHHFRSVLKLLIKLKMIIAVLIVIQDNCDRFKVGLIIRDWTSRCGYQMYPQVIKSTNWNFPVGSGNTLDLHHLTFAFL